MLFKINIMQHTCNIYHIFNFILQWNPYMQISGWYFFILAFNVIFILASSNLNHWGLVKNICINNLNTIGSDNGLSPSRRQANIWTNAWILLISPSRTNSIWMLIVIHKFSFKKMHLKMSSAKWLPFCLSLNMLMNQFQAVSGRVYRWLLQAYQDDVENHYEVMTWIF